MRHLRTPLHTSFFPDFFLPLPSCFFQARLLLRQVYSLVSIAPVAHPLVNVLLPRLRLLGCHVFTFRSSVLAPSPIDNHGANRQMPSSTFYPLLGPLHIISSTFIFVISLVSCFPFGPCSNSVSTGPSLSRSLSRPLNPLPSLSHTHAFLCTSPFAPFGFK